MSASSEREGSISDPYVEHLRQKYLINDDSSVPSESSANGCTTEVGTFSDLPPNPSLTESERKHYNRAMKELKKALKFSENSLMASIVEFEETMKSATPTRTEKASRPNDAISSGSDTVGKSTTLPTLSPPASKFDKEKISTFATSEEALSSQSSLAEFESLSKIYSCANRDGTISISTVRAIYSELMNIYRKLQDERGRIAQQQRIENKLEANFELREEELVRRETFLLQKEKELLEREHALSIAQSNMKKTQDVVEKLEGVELEVQERLDLLQQHHELELERVDSALVEKCRDAKRLKASFDNVRDQNDDLRTQLAALTDESKKLKVQNNKLKKRTENLQRRQDYKELKPPISASQTLEKENAMKKAKPSAKTSEKVGKQTESALEALSVVLEWLCESHLKDSETFQKQVMSKSLVKSKPLSNEYVTDKCLKVLPLFVDIIRSLPSQSLSAKQQMAFLSFIYWSLCHLDDSQHSLVSSTARRIGEELYKPLMISGAAKKSSAALILATTTGSSAFNSLENLGDSVGVYDSKSHPNAYFRSSCLEIRMLSSFIVLKTLHQVDVLAHVFDRLAKDLKEERNREMFLEYKAGHIVLPYVTYKANGALLSNAVDVVLQLSVESALLPSFLEHCSNEAWFRAFSSALRVPTSTGSSRTTMGLVTLEKLSIILQKLSKIKSNRRFFEAFSMARNLQEWYRSCDAKNTFLSLNLRSILFNLDMLKGNAAASEEN